VSDDPVRESDASGDPAGAVAEGAGRTALRAVAQDVRTLLDRLRGDAIDQLSAGVAYFAFLALVPVLLLATAVAGFLLDDVHAQRAVAGAITSALPGLETAVQPGGPFDELLATLVRRRGQLGLVGAASLLWVAIRLSASLMAGVEAAFRVPRRTGPAARIRQLAALGALGLVTVAAFVASGLASGLLPWLPGPALTVVTFAIGALFDLLLFLVAYRVLLPTVPSAGPSEAAARTTWALHLPGALLGAAGWTGLKVFGATIVGIRLQSAGAVYGTLAGVATVLVLLYVMSRLFLTGAVVSAVYEERRREPQR
jgi:membrane protein